MEKHVVATVAEIPVGGRKLVDVKGRPIVLFNIKGEFYAISNRCPHQGGPLAQGNLTGLIEAKKPGEYTYTRKGEVIRCPWHGWEYDIKTGKSWCDPRRIMARRFDVNVESGAALVEGPYVAETFQVSVENDYLVIEM